MTKQSTAHDDSQVPAIRIRTANDAPIRADGEFVLYWMIAQRRAGWNFALDRACEIARGLGRPLVVLEGLRSDYRWASDRMHRFVLQGMAANEARFSEAGVCYYPYVEPEPRAGNGLLEALAKRACAVVTDDFPCYFLPRMVAVAARRIDVRCEAIDSNGLLPMRAPNRIFLRAVDFRRYLQRELGPHLLSSPAEKPFDGKKHAGEYELPRAITKHWARASAKLLRAEASDLAALPIDHRVGAAIMEGGSDAAEKTMRLFLKQRLATYIEDRNEPDDDAASGLSPYLHFGHLSAHEIFQALAKQEDWSPAKLKGKGNGERAGWWQMSESAEAFLDQLTTWRELGYNGCTYQPGFDQYDSLPAWARESLAKHESDTRANLYTLDEFAAADTHDELWNAAQRQLVREGRLHNYLRMLWGKKILEWSPSPREALAHMIELNNRFAVDGRNPNSYSGIMWCLGRYDRPWGPERPIYGNIRYMSSDNTSRKLNTRKYLERYSANA